MAKKDNTELKKFLQPFGKEITARVLWLRDFVWNLYPQANELIYDNYNALAFGWSLTERLGHTFCSIAVGRTSHNVHFGFYRGNELTDPKKILQGEGNQYRYILVPGLEKFPEAYIKKLMKEACSNALAGVKDKNLLAGGKTIVKSISAAKRK